MIALRFIADRSFVSRAIQFRTDDQRGPSHVEYLLIEDGKPKLTFGARLEGGVTYRPYGYCKPTWERWATYPGIEEAYQEALAFNGRPYDWQDVLFLGIGWKPGLFDPQHEFCSNLVGYADRRAWAKGTVLAALVNPEAPAWEMTPGLIWSQGILEPMSMEAT